MVYSASMVKALDAGKPATDFFTDQLLYVAFGAACALFLWKVVPYRFWVGPIVWAVWAVAVARIFAVWLAGTDHYGAQRWLYIGPVGLQPSEFCKIAFILVAVRLVVDWRAGLVESRATMVRALIFIIAPIALMYRTQSDLGTTAICFVGILAVMWMGGVSRRVIFACLGVAVLGGLVAIFGTGYRSDRLVFMDPWNDGEGGYGTGYNIIRSYYALAEGGIFGVGLGNSHEKFQYLFASESDFIFAVIGAGSITIVLNSLGSIDPSMANWALNIHFTPFNWIGAVLLWIICGPIALGFLLVAGRNLPAADYGTIAYWEVPVAIFVGLVVFGEALTINTIIGGLLIIGGGAVPSIRGMIVGRKQKQQEEISENLAARLEKAEEDEHLQ